MMRWFVLLAAGALCSCASEFQQVEVDAPTGAQVVILAGAGTPRIETKTPFIGRFEAVSLADWSAYRLELQMDAKTAARYGGSGPLTLYGHLVVGPPTELSKQLTVTLKMPDAMIEALVRGTRVEAEVHVDDPTPQQSARLAQLTLRTAPF